MIQAAVIFRVLGMMSAFFGIALGVPWLFALTIGDGSARSLGAACGIAFGIAGILLATTPRARHEVNHREGFLIVTLTWCLAIFLGALPYLFSGLATTVTDATFEATSGFTTTGSTILSGLDNLPHPLLLWRAITQWLGGMGMILLSIAILPLLGVGGMQLFKAEAPGPVADKIRPRVKDTAARLWGIYTFFTLAESLALILLGVSPFDALCHSLTTLPGGGFSTHDASIAYFNSPGVDAVVSLFMIVGGINFVLYFRIAAGGWRDIPRESELKFFALLFGGACAATILSLRIATYPDWSEAIRYGVFQVASCISTTGFATADYETWPHLPQILLMILMLTGAMAGSTSGAIKNMRVLLLFKQGYQQLRLLIHPHAVSQVRMSGRAVAPEIIHSIWGFFFLYLAIFAVASMVLAALGLDLVTATTAVITAMGNCGPGLGAVGPTETFELLPAAAKWTLCVCMVLGRLELYTVLVLLLPEYWRP
jgi:trk system potassium uptake protein TrkH